MRKGETQLVAHLQHFISKLEGARSKSPFTGFEQFPASQEQTSELAPPAAFRPVDAPPKVKQGEQELLQLSSSHSSSVTK